MGKTLSSTKSRLIGKETHDNIGNWCGRFIGAHFCKALLERGEEVVGIDSLNDYYTPTLKQARLDDLSNFDNFVFQKLDICDKAGLEALGQKYAFTKVVHLAAQAGVRYSLENPDAYIAANLIGHANILEFCRHAKKVEHLIAASSSSVYGGNTKIPFSEADPVDRPVSLYAATKKADELLSHSYAHLFDIPQTLLRFFTVYGPMGRPDMAYWSFTERILKGEPIRVFNNGDMRRDFTYIDDVVAGMLSILDRGFTPVESGAPFRVYNIGNNRPEPLLRMIEVLEEALGVQAEKIFEPMQPGDVKETYADISAIQRDYDYAPATPIDQGLPQFVQWYRGFYNL